MNFSKLTNSCTMHKVMDYKNYYGSVALLAVKDDSNIQEVLCAQFYTIAARTYCAVRLHLRDKFGFGVAYVQGHGYDRASSAFASALKAAGVGDVTGIARTGMSYAMTVVREELERELDVKLQEFQFYA